MIVLAMAMAMMSAALEMSDASVHGFYTAVFHVCGKDPRNGGTLQQAMCVGEELARQDALLNEQWRRTLSVVSPSLRGGLVRDERRWTGDRDRQCREEGGEFVNSTAAYMEGVCRVDATIRRRVWLKTMR